MRHTPHTHWLAALGTVALLLLQSGCDDAPLVRPDLEPPPVVEPDAPLSSLLGHFGAWTASGAGSSTDLSGESGAAMMTWSVGTPDTHTFEFSTTAQRTGKVSVPWVLRVCQTFFFSRGETSIRAFTRTADGTVSVLLHRGIRGCSVFRSGIRTFDVEEGDEFGFQVVAETPLVDDEFQTRSSGSLTIPRSPWSEAGIFDGLVQDGRSDDPLATFGSTSHEERSGDFTTRSLVSGAMLVPWVISGCAGSATLRTLPGLQVVRTFSGCFSEAGTVLIPVSQSSDYGLRLTVRKDPDHPAAEGSLRIGYAGDAPVADAGPDATLTRTSPDGVDVTLDGSASTDDGTIQTYTWWDGLLEHSGETVDVTLPLGTRTFQLRVVDDEYRWGADEVTYTVLNALPTVDAGPDQEIEATGPTTEVSLSGSASDVDGTIESTEWTDAAGNPVSSELSPTLDLAPGEHVLTLTVTDNDGGSSSDDVVVRVTDTTPPDLTFGLDVTDIWPPDGGMVTVASGIAALDLVDGAVPVAITVESDEVIDGSDGEGVDYAVIESPDGTYAVQVRAERDGEGDGRIYTITVVATDAAGNSSTATGVVGVAHDQREGGGA